MQNNKSIMPKKKLQEKTMLNLHLVLVTLHMQINTSIEQDK